MSKVTLELPAADHAALLVLLSQQRQQALLAAGKPINSSADCVAYPNPATNDAMLSALRSTIPVCDGDLAVWDASFSTLYLSRFIAWGINATKITAVLAPGSSPAVQAAELGGDDIAVALGLSRGVCTAAAADSSSGGNDEALALGLGLGLGLGLLAAVLLGLLCVYR
jgi:hypothetical protein